MAGSVFLLPTTIFALMASHIFLEFTRFQVRCGRGQATTLNADSCEIRSISKCIALWRTLPPLASLILTGDRCERRDMCCSCFTTQPLLQSLFNPCLQNHCATPGASFDRWLSLSILLAIKSHRIVIICKVITPLRGTSCITSPFPGVYGATGS